MKNCRGNKIDFYVIAIFFLLAVIGIPAAAAAIYQQFSELNHAYKEATAIETDRMNIYSIYADSGSAGTLTLGCGSIKYERYYVFYIEKDDGGKILKEIPAKNTTIYEILGEGETAYVEYDYNVYGIKAYRLYVPEDSLIQEYEFMF